MSNHNDVKNVTLETPTHTHIQRHLKFNSGTLEWRNNNTTNMNSFQDSHKLTTVEVKRVFICLFAIFSWQNRIRVVWVCVCVCFSFTEKYWGWTWMWCTCLITLQTLFACVFVSGWMRVLLLFFFSFPFFCLLFEVGNLWSWLFNLKCSLDSDTAAKTSQQQVCSGRSCQM